MNPVPPAGLDLKRVYETGRTPPGFELLAWLYGDGRFDPARTHPAAPLISRTIRDAKRSGRCIPWRRVMLRAGVPRSEFPSHWSSAEGPKHLAQFLAGFSGVRSYVLSAARRPGKQSGLVQFSVVETWAEERVRSRLVAIPDALAWLEPFPAGPSG